MAAAGPGVSWGSAPEDEEPLPPHLRDISVTDPVKHGEGVKAYMSYRVVSKGSDGQSEKPSIRRFSDFEWLHTRLCSLHRGVIVPPLPDKNVVEKFRFSEDFIETRRRGLEKFVNRVAQHPTLRQANELRHFLEDDEDTWSRQTMVAADVRGGVLGKKSSEYMNIFKEMQWSLSSVVMGRPAPTAGSPAAPPPAAAPGHVRGLQNGAPGGPLVSCSEDENEMLKAYAEELERVFTDAHKQASMLLKKQKETAASLASLGTALVALGKAEGSMGQKLTQRQQGSGSEGRDSATNGQGSEGSQSVEKQQQQQQAAQLMNRAFVDVGRRCEAAATLIYQQGTNYAGQVDEPLKEYIRMVISFKRVLSEQSAAVREERHLEAELQMKKARLEKLNATLVAGAMDRLKEAEADITEAQSRLTSAVAQREKLTQSMQADIQRFHRVMLADVGCILGDIKALHSQLAQKSYRCWSEGLPLLREARVKLHETELPVQSKAVGQVESSVEGGGQDPAPASGMS